ncbi:sensor histidine kinase [Yeosuana marina]|uniref:sensor histidine kinase n=1 Tax=Yeosuana marina TaxID=1565536 RepID=UPI0030C85CE5
MKHFLVSLTFLLFIYDNSQSQENFSANDSIINKIESYILYEQLDSVSHLIPKLDKTSYLESLIRIYKNNKPTYSDYYEFISSLTDQLAIDFRDVSNYINTNIKEPAITDDINLDYVNILWIQVSKLRDEASIGEASAEQEKLENYISQFNQNNVNNIKAELLASTHQIVLYQIQEDIKSGKELCLKNLQKARNLGDGKLEIVFLYHLCDFYVLERKLDEFIEASEQSLEIEKKLPNHSPYYIGTVKHLLDAYIYKGGYDKKVEELLKQLYVNHETKADSYSLYAKYIGTLNTNSPKTQSIFEQFEVSNLLDFCKKIENLGEKALNPNDFFQVLNESSNALAKHGFFNESLEYKNKCIQLTRKIYSQDLAQSLSSFKTKQAIKEKELEIAYVKERSNLYIVIASLVAILLLIVFVFLLRKQNQSKILAQKNSQINQSLKEKELLVKEVHHRVKNNFQIIASLMELQIKDIKDKKALEFANDSMNRLKSMSLIHQKLYQKNDELINFEKYIRLLVNEVSLLYASNKKIDTHICVNNLFFDVDTAVPLGLIINELLTNAYKYAFSEDFDGELEISIDKIENGGYKLVISDNGPGFNDDFNINKVESFGLKLVKRLVKQLQGNLSLLNNKGAIFQINFKDLNTRRSID